MKSLEEIGCGHRCSLIGKESYPREKWGKGPWDQEPDRVDFAHAGLPCLLHRARLGNWCGYVGVPPEHPFHGVGYSGCPQGCAPEPFAPDAFPDSVPLPELVKTRMEQHPLYLCGHSPGSVLSVHGGLTYADTCSGHLCHIPKLGEPDSVWWFGFDMAHGGDYSPGMRVLELELRFPRNRHDRYRDMAYARRETERLAEQLAAIKP